MKKTIRDIKDWQEKRVLVRVDFNVPLDPDGKITDESRITATLPTLKYLAERDARIIVVSHLGRPKGKPDPAFSLQPVAHRLQELLPSTAVKHIDKVIGPEVTNAVNGLQPGEILLLENVRFEAGEEKNDPELAKALAGLCDIYVNDAFGAAHRAHASTEGVAHFVPLKVAGLLMEKEITALSLITQNPQKPAVAIIGGSKISTKITVLNNLLGKVDTLIIGGGMVYTFLKAKGYEIGTSIAEPDFVGTANQLLQDAEVKGTKIALAADIVVTQDFKADAPSKVVLANGIEAGWMGMDTGPESIKAFQAILKDAKTVLWNGPLGVFEFPAFSRGTRAIADTLVETTKSGQCQTVLGGGDTVAALEGFGLRHDQFTHVSTGGGASLEFMEGKPLPGIAVLDEQAAPVTA